MATEVISTIRASGGDYTSLSAWEAGEQGNLVSADEIRTAECYDDWPSGLTDTVTIDGSTTDSTRYLRITVPSGHRHLGVPKAGFHLISSTTARVVYNQDDYTRIEWIDAETTGSAGYAYQSASGNPVVFDRCIGKASTGNGRGWSTITSTQVLLQCLAYACGQHGYSFVASASPTVYNCIAAGCSNGFTGGTSNAVLRNCVAYNNGTNYSGSFGGSSSHNATSSGSDDAPGDDSVISIDSSDFVDAAGNDFHLASGSALIGVGANLYSDFTADVDGDTWPSSGAWDIGFDHYSAGGSDATATGQTLTATGSLIAGAASASSQAAAQTLTAAASLVAGAASAASQAPAQTLTATASLVPGAAGASAAAAGGTLTATASLLAGAAAASAQADGQTLPATASLVPGAASADAQAGAVTLTAAASLITGTASGTGDATAPGVVLGVSSALVAGSASASSQAAGQTLTASASVIVAAATASSSSPSATLLATASLLAGGVVADAVAEGRLLEVMATLIAGGATAGDDEDEIVLTPGLRRAYLPALPRNVQMGSGVAGAGRSVFLRQE